MTDIRPEAVGVTIEDVSLSFGTTEVLKGITLKIEPGEFFTFLGPSGSGKSTLLRAIAGFGPTPAGRILIGDDDVTHLVPWRRNVGMVFQSYALWPHMTVRKNVAFGLEERKVGAREISSRVDAALDLVGLREFAERRPSQLSGGQQQRVALARTVVVEPRVLLLDEPLSNLDANLRVQMRRDILELQRELKLTTIFVTHDQEEANTTSDRIAVLNDGLIQQVGSPMELYDNPANRFVAYFLGTANLIDGRVEIEATTPVFQADDGTRISLAGRELPAGAGTAMFRPQDLTIGKAGADDAAAGGVVLPGSIRHREFLGSLVRYSVRVGTREILVDDSHHAGGRIFDVGEDVDLHLDVDRVQVLGV
ncbi:MAG: ABC transporter ATP-binding protein [Alphaproteobacteria bacterium]|nr:ABC transporter ATP-binding protein [Alphaproteobacteria bacterium]MCZ6742069.1 ABC transporter ATP-binding protein [Alphaproteobacteria bacterium]